MKVIRAVCRFFTGLCMLFIVALMLLMVAEVLSRAIIHRAILGSTEWAQVLLLCNMSAFGASVLTNRQIKVNMLTSHFSPKAQVALDTVILFLTCATVAVLSWQQFNYSVKSFQQHIFYTNIQLPQWPFVVVFAASYGIAAITILSLVIRKIVALATGDWEAEAKREDMDEIFVFGKGGRPVRESAADENPPETDGSDTNGGEAT